MRRRSSVFLSAKGPELAPKLRIVIIGGTVSHRGGLEAFCERAQAAIAIFGKDIDAEWLPSDSAYLAPHRWRAYLTRLFRTYNQRRKFDLAWIQISNLPDLAFVLVCKIVRMPVLATPHFGANSRLQRSVWRRPLCRGVLGLADQIGLLFDGQANEIALPLKPARETIGTFLPVSSFDPHEEGQGTRSQLCLVHAARFSEEKGSFAVVDLCAKLFHDCVPFEAILVGRADEVIMEQLRSKIAHHQLQDRITIMPWLDEQAMQALLRKADVLVHLSRIDSFPLIVLEALAAGTLPLIRRMTGSEAMVTAFGGHVVSEPDSAHAGAAWLAGRPVSEIRLAGQRAGQLVRESYSWDRIVSELSGLFNRMVGSKNGPHR
ncbi:glycosyltransferase family 4 protein [Novosphingobium album (ex Liu et al. 2023)]|uniref:Glycosyltransferase family 4 protein n=1 Tax=Novosphingobium album (ex Liu et al. 2023) TaxID=3031130 RepID=A0ABT5WQG7_9SPHN|nr:glycosyltransferase family 4 protein [Novosphingobium album (ex Liu et al. 2023)]MDE8652296.1 glycosyltransferase family 4 protein [Novosphingobium album (ex Liu et al. 2023)]